MFIRFIRPLLFILAVMNATQLYAQLFQDKASAPKTSTAPAAAARNWQKPSSIPLKELFPKAEANQVAACGNLMLSDEEQFTLYEAYSPLKSKQNWLILVDPQNTLTRQYKPEDLTTVSNKAWPKPVRLRKEALDQMNKMIKAAKQDNVTLIPLSTYRTWQYQDGLYQRNLAKNGGKPTGYVARAGESQHHLGTAVDFNTVEPKDENIPALVWLRKHAGEYGFSLSFPKGAAAEKESGYPYEAWHYRYITPEAVRLQDKFFKGDQHKTLSFLQRCVFGK